MPYFIIAASAVFFDQLTKAWVLGSFQLYESKEVIPGLFNLVYVTNSGAAFSILADVLFDNFKLGVNRAFGDHFTQSSPRANVELAHKPFVRLRGLLEGVPTFLLVRYIVLRPMYHRAALA